MLFLNSKDEIDKIYNKIKMVSEAPEPDDEEPNYSIDEEEPTTEGETTSEMPSPDDEEGIDEGEETTDPDASGSDSDSSSSSDEEQNITSTATDNNKKLVLLKNYKDLTLEIFNVIESIPLLRERLDEEALISKIDLIENKLNKLLSNLKFCIAKKYLNLDYKSLLTIFIMSENLFKELVNNLDKILKMVKQ